MLLPREVQSNSSIIDGTSVTSPHLRRYFLTVFNVPALETLLNTKLYLTCLKDQCIVKRQCTTVMVIVIKHVYIYIDIYTP